MSRSQLTATTQQNTGGAIPPFTAGKNKIINGEYTSMPKSVWDEQQKAIKDNAE